MVKKSSPQVTPSAFAKLAQSIEACTVKVEELERQAEMHMHRIMAMQAEIDHLRALLRGV